MIKIFSSGLAGIILFEGAGFVANKLSTNKKQALRTISLRVVL
jgi:hypothetical protein